MGPVRACSVAEVRAAEAPLLAAGVPLMARAAAGLAEHLRRCPGSRILVLAGSGDNGGDALFAAAELAAGGREVAAARVGGDVHAGAWETALEAGVREVASAAAAALATEDTVVVDGMRGIGGSGAGLRGTARDVALAIRERIAASREGARPFVVAVDVPSGIDADTGDADPAVIPADLTVTFGAVKTGLLRDPARALAGRVELVDIGLALDGATGSD